MLDPWLGGYGERYPSCIPWNLGKIQLEYTSLSGLVFADLEALVEGGFIESLTNFDSITPISDTDIPEPATISGLLLVGATFVLKAYA